MADIAAARGETSADLEAQEDVTADSTGATELERLHRLERARGAQERARLHRVIGDLLATSRLGPGELCRTIADLACSTIGEGAAIRILTSDLRTVEREVMAHPDESVRLRLTGVLQRSGQDLVTVDGIQRVCDQAAHVLIASVRHNGTALGTLAVFRADPDDLYQAGDDDVLQVLADSAGAAIGENRIWQQADRERDERLTALANQHLELLEKLAGIETRERSLLAEAIHDEPVQRIVAGILRLDHLASRLEPAAQGEINDITEHLVGTVDWLRDLIVAALTPPDLAAGLGPALAGLARGIFKSTPTVFTVVGPDHVPLSVPSKETAYRIFREAMSNTRKHAVARNATLRLGREGELVVISLTDDGVGSPSLDAGAGHFGMATMRARALAEGAELLVDSVPGLGTIVKLTLPAVPKAAAGAPAGQPGDTARQVPVDLDCLRTVVVCDDHQYLRDAVKLVLSSVPRFHVVGEASDGDTCLARVTRDRPDVLILDVSMPGGGPTLAKRAKELHPDMHIVAFSGRQDEQTRIAMLAAGADQYVVKTGRLQPLVEALDQLIATSQRPAPTRL